MVYFIGNWVIDVIYKGINLLIFMFLVEFFEVFSVLMYCK